MGLTAEVLAVPTPVGTASVTLSPPGPGHQARVGLLCLGHGAGGGIAAPDLVAVTVAAQQAGWAVALVEQPYRVGGRRAPDRADKLDSAWLAVTAALREAHPGLPLVTGGRSSGARVACRTARAAGAIGVVCLAFPLRPPRHPERSRAAELLGAGVPVLVVQGDRDPFGRPAELPAGPQVVAVAGDHSLRRSADAVAAAVVGWLAQRVA